MDSSCRKPDTGKSFPGKDRDTFGVVRQAFAKIARRGLLLPIGSRIREEVAIELSHRFEDPVIVPASGFRE
jgi:hypothetical protein